MDELLPGRGYGVVVVDGALFVEGAVNDSGDEWDVEVVRDDGYRHRDCAQGVEDFGAVVLEGCPARWFVAGLRIDGRRSGVPLWF